MERTLYQRAIEDCAFHHNKMAFLAGPRQVGKTTLSKLILKQRHHGGKYSTWEEPVFRKQWINDPVTLVPEPASKISLPIIF